MKRKRIVLTLLTAIVLAGSALLLFAKNNQSNILPQDLYNKFECGRLTLDERETDKYCENYKLYKKDHSAGKI